MNPQLVASLIAVAVILLVGFPVHEFSHALAADRLGDRTARHLGRLSLDPRVHFDPLGAGLLVLSAIAGGFFIGWAKPTPVNPANLQGGHRGEAIVAGAGPVSNLIMAGLVAIAVRVIIAFALLNPSAGSVQELLLEILLYLILINVFLFIFNLLPIPPLDGYKVLLGAVSPRTAWQIRRYEQYALLLIVVLFLLGGPIIGPIGTGIANFLVGQTIF
ncbi:MAG: site-2 protease family protein [Candidatus Limnocylindrales bacterium]